jgi:putative addiction module killer protein
MSLKKEIKVYKTTRGKAPFRDWLDALKDKIIRARIDRRLERLADGNYGDSKSVGEGVFEMRLQFGAGYRIYFGEINCHVVLLLSGGSKSSQVKDIKLAQ